jgi:cytochrome c oxidase subunit 2
MVRGTWIRRVAALAPIVTALVLAISPGHGAYADNGPRVVEITAKRFGFTPNQISLKKGETVTLRLHSEDVTHGFFMRKLKIDSAVEAGQTTDVTITPETAGSFYDHLRSFLGANEGNIKDDDRGGGVGPRVDATSEFVGVDAGGSGRASHSSRLDARCERPVQLRPRSCRGLSET